MAAKTLFVKILDDSAPNILLYFSLLFTLLLYFASNFCNVGVIFAHLRQRKEVPVNLEESSSETANDNSESVSSVNERIGAAASKEFKVNDYHV